MALEKNLPNIIVLIVSSRINYFQFRNAKRSLVLIFTEGRGRVEGLASLTKYEDVVQRSEEKKKRESTEIREYRWTHRS